MPAILVTNDDGISSPGIKALARTLKTVGDVYVVAPETEQSAVGHALTLHRPLKFEKVAKNTYYINGTPTDCVIIGVNKLLPRKPDIIVSGINIGANLGDNITYSGTVAAAIEGTLLGIPSIAVSLAIEGQNSNGSRKSVSKFHGPADFVKELALKVLDKGLPADTLLNVNVPDGKKINGVKITRQGKLVYDNSIQELVDPRGREYYWIGGGIPQWESGGNTDFEAVKNGYISITPVHLDLTNYPALEYLKDNWKI
ncbi:MAG: 5'/3'-nucleotidase SurE [Thermodesulfovibrionia bacterium]|nr:5'/3'-nucleotidase SurE [Thermodesulfovibrionia bacterium]